MDQFFDSEDGLMISLLTLCVNRNEKGLMIGLLTVLTAMNSAYCCNDVILLPVLLVSVYVGLFGGNCTGVDFPKRRAVVIFISCIILLLNKGYCLLVYF